MTISNEASDYYSTTSLDPPSFQPTEDQQLHDARATKGYTANYDAINTVSLSAAASLWTAYIHVTLGE